MRTFKHAIRHSDFAVSAEIYLRPETSAESVREQAAILKPCVDAILLTDNQYGQLHMSTLAAAAILLNMEVDPIVQLTCRNRNRIALVSDLLGAGVLGVTSLLLVAGERAPKGFRPRPKAVLDLKAVELIRTAATIREDERLKNQPDFLIGALVVPVTPGPRWKPAKLTEKIDAGARFVQTNLCMDVNLLRRYLRRLVSERVTHRARVVVSVGILESADDARWLRENRPNVAIPDAVVARLEKADDPAREGEEICVEIVQALRDVPGVDGVNIMATRDLSAIPRVVQAAGLEAPGE